MICEIKIDAIQVLSELNDIDGVDDGDSKGKCGNYMLEVMMRFEGMKLCITSVERM